MKGDFIYVVASRELALCVSKLHKLHLKYLNHELEEVVQLTAVTLTKSRTEQHFSCNSNQHITYITVHLS